MRRFAVLACLALAVVSLGQQLKPPTSQEEDNKKFHQPKVKGTPASARLQGYALRQKMEADSYFTKLAWRSIGPEEQGGRVIWFDSPKNKPNSLYVAYATGGLWRSDDMGNNWTSLFDDQPAFAIGHVALSKDGNTIWVGTGENNSQRTSYDGLGVYKSTDAGKTWNYMGLGETQRIGKIVISPKNENVVYVGAIGGLYSQGNDRGVYKTTDGGKTWSHVLKFDDDYTGVVDLAVDPRNSDVVYAAAWDRDRRAWDFRDGGPGTAIYKTVNGGKSWTKLEGGLPASGNLGRIGIALAPSKPDRLYVYVDNRGGDPDTLFRDENLPSGNLTAPRFHMIQDPKVFTAIDIKILDRFVSNNLPRGTKAEDIVKAVNDGKMTLADIAKKMEERNPNVWEMEVMQSEVYRTDDAGKSWNKTNVGYIDTEGYGYYCGRISVNPADPDDVTITSMLLYRSRDGGRTFASSVGRGVHVDFHYYWFDPTNPRFQAVGSDGGLYFSYDDGDTWRHINNMAVGQWTTIAVDNKTPYNVIGGMQDNGTSRGPSNYRPGLDDMARWVDVGGGDGSAVAVDPRDDGDMIYGSSQFGSFYFRNTKTNEVRGVRPRGEGPTDQLRFNWISPILVSPHHPDIVYVGSNKLHRSLNQGRSFETISPDLTRNKPNGDVPFSTLKDISESPLKFGVIYTGADDGRVMVTKDFGTTWQDISTPQPDKWVSRVVASKYDKGTVFVSQTGYRDDDYTPYLWKSTDYGKSWSSITGNLPPEPINVIREDPDKKDWLYVGTDLGVYVSFDGGKAWTPLNGGIPRTPVHDIAVQARERELAIATHARSAWIFKLKDLEKVYDVRDKDLFVWPISDMIRGNWEYRGRFDSRSEEEEEEEAAQGQGGGRGPGRFGGGDPELNGEVFTKTPGKGKVRILDKDGKVVLEREFDWTRGYNTFNMSLLTKQGKPRFSTDVKNRKVTTVEEAIKDPYADERNQYVPAGEYKVEVSVGDKVQTVTWKLGS